MTIRSFVALPVPEPVAAGLGDTAARLASQDKDGRVRWIEESNYHITLAFLGEVNEQLLDDLAMDLDEQLFARGSLDIHVESVAPFPFGRRPRLIAGMVESTDQLRGLQKMVVQASRRRGMLVEKRRFHPHVTLGRLRSGGSRRFRFPPGSMDLHGVAGTVSIFESTLTPNGAIYDPLYEIQLENGVEADVPGAQLGL